MAPHALVLTGGLAVGKTAVAREVVVVAAERGLRVAAIDLDWLGWTSSTQLPVDELISRNLAAVAANYRVAGIDRLVLARALVAPASLVAIGQALPDWNVTVVRLTAPRPTIERRIRVRDSGVELEEHLGQIDDITSRTNLIAADAPVVVNDGGSLREAALDVIRIAGW
jgi:hypothetical protein